MGEKFTSGPWQVGAAFDNDGVPEIIIESVTSAGNLVVAVALGGLNGQEANAILIAAAPDLLEVVREVFVIGDRLVDDVYGYEFVKKAKAAIVKATGGAA